MTTSLKTLQHLTLSVLLAAGLAFASIAAIQPEAALARAEGRCEDRLNDEAVFASAISRDCRQG